MKKALDGIRVIDFSWVLAGPGTTRILADYGAEVIKVESKTHLDVIRTSPPYGGGKAGVNNSGYWSNYHLNKFGMTLNLNHLKGIDIAKQLVAKADIVVENYIPGTMDRWGLGYKDLAKVNPDIIMASISLFGQNGPYKTRFGFGAFAEGMSGMFNLFGWPDRAPSYFQQVIGDALVPYMTVTALMGALEHRDKTGLGQLLDVNQLDVCSYLMSPVVLDANLNGHETRRNGNRSEGACPHGVYPCSGKDKWCAIAVTNDQEWRNLCAAMNSPEWASKPEYTTFIGRKKDEETLDSLIGNWTAAWDNNDLMNYLQKHGVPAGAVITGRGMTEDPQLQLFLARTKFTTFGNHIVDHLCRKVGVRQFMSYPSSSGSL